VATDGPTEGTLLVRSNIWHAADLDDVLSRYPDVEVCGRLAKGRPTMV
jgi:hypothetical protein